MDDPRQQQLAVLESPRPVTFHSYASDCVCHEGDHVSGNDLGGMDSSALWSVLMRNQHRVEGQRIRVTVEVIPEHGFRDCVCRSRQRGETTSECKATEHDYDPIPEECGHVTNGMGPCVRPPGHLNEPEHYMHLNEFGTEYTHSGKVGLGMMGSDMRPAVAREERFAHRCETHGTKADIRNGVGVIPKGCTPACVFIEGRFKT